MLSLTVALCHLGLRAGLDENLKNAPAAREALRAYRLLVAIRDAIPEAATVMSDQRFGAALKDPSKAVALYADIAKLRESHAAKIDAVLASVRSDPPVQGRADR